MIQIGKQHGSKQLTHNSTHETDIKITNRETEAIMFVLSLNVANNSIGLFISTCYNLDKPVNKADEEPIIVNLNLKVA